MHGTFWFGPLGSNLSHILSANTLTDSDFAFLVPQMIYLLDRNQIISHSVNKSEIHPALSEIAKFISLSIVLARLLSQNFAEGKFSFTVKIYFIIICNRI